MAIEAARGLDGFSPKGQESEFRRGKSGSRWTALMLAIVLGIDLVIAVLPRQTICSSRQRAMRPHKEQLL
jgi:hypothetical protein